jgi:hypothetical protein
MSRKLPSQQTMESVTGAEPVSQEEATGQILLTVETRDLLWAEEISARCNARKPTRKVTRQDVFRWAIRYGRPTVNANLEAIYRLEPLRDRGIDTDVTIDREGVRPTVDLKLGLDLGIPEL